LGANIGGTSNIGGGVGAGLPAGTGLLANGDTTGGMTINPVLATTGIAGGPAVTDQVPPGGYVIPTGAPETGFGGAAWSAGHAVESGSLAALALAAVLGGLLLRRVSSFRKMVRA
jgi:hypothetical protein